jgi:hypothetical protein
VSEPAAQQSGAAPPGQEPEGSDGLVQRVLRWLRAGYPEGVPQQDYVALLGILRRTLTPVELDRVVQELAEEARSHQNLVTPALIQQRISDVVKGPIHDDDLVRVSARLAAAGWPLGTPDTGEQSVGDPADERLGLVGRVAEWLRAGYPSGLPERDFVPLVALLRRRLSDEEVRDVARRLVDSGVLPSDRVDIGTAIATVTAELPSDGDIARVRDYLSTHGWPVDFTV